MLHPYMKRSRSSPGLRTSPRPARPPRSASRRWPATRALPAGPAPDSTCRGRPRRSAPGRPHRPSWRRLRAGTRPRRPVRSRSRDHGRPRWMVCRGRLRRPVRVDRRERSRASTSLRRSRCRPRVPAGSALRRSWTSRMAGSHSLPRRCVMAGRLKLAWPSRMSAPYASHPWPAPDRYTSATAGNWPIAATTIRDSGAIRLRLCGSTSTSRKPSGRLNRCSASTSRMPPTPAAPATRAHSAHRSRFETRAHRRSGAVIGQRAIPAKPIAEVDPRDVEGGHGRGEDSLDQSVGGHVMILLLDDEWELESGGKRRSWPCRPGRPRCWARRSRDFRARPRIRPTA